MKTIALIDPFWSGHHSMYLKLFSKTILSLGHKVMIFSSRPQLMRDWAEVNFKQHHDKIYCYEIQEPKQSVFPVKIVKQALDGIKLWLSADKAIKKAYSDTGCFPDLVFFPWLDSYLSLFQNRYLLDKIFPHNWSGLMFHPYHLRLKLSFLSSRRGPFDLDEALKSSRCKAIAVLDEGVAQKLQENLQGKQVVIFPDVTDASPPDREFPIAKKITVAANGRKIIALLGSLDRRKGMLTLLKVTKSISCEDCFFVFAGKLADESFSSDELEALKSIAYNPPHNCFFHLDFIPDEPAFNALVEMSDILFAAYENFLHSSNILTKAAVFKKPLIVSKGYCMEERVKAYHLGVSVECGNVPECAEAIRHLLNPNNFKGDFDGYMEAHSKERLKPAFKEIFDNYSGIIQEQ